MSDQITGWRERCQALRSEIETAILENFKKRPPGTWIKIEAVPLLGTLDVRLDRHGKIEIFSSQRNYWILMNAVGLETLIEIAEASSRDGTRKDPG